METLSRRYHVRRARAARRSSRVERAAIYRRHRQPPEDPANLFRIAIAFERRAVFSSQSAAPARPRVRPSAALRELAAEEREHAALLTTEYERRAQGKAGLL